MLWLCLNTEQCCDSPRLRCIRIAGWFGAWFLTRRISKDRRILLETRQLKGGQALFITVLMCNVAVRKGRKERKEGKEVTCGQVWWPILGICALHITHPSVHTQQPMMRCRGAVGGSVPCSRASQSWYWGWRESAGHSLPPPTIPAGS